eukprot:CAMPEP_0184290968 /NCGR_PEP_ID=MMETSP1049-20130417/3093_1 /TAXON_ID=77928 /ORGANISM="Proteomonas sulcata, Strain CCMP704" /LENGTH=227 /DNA_ID=CAMNT_0026598267 /DNA_START=107 /DNA_END=790 /DNA_ORIENTATION=-
MAYHSRRRWHAGSIVMSKWLIRKGKSAFWQWVRYLESCKKVDDRISNQQAIENWKLVSRHFTWWIYVVTFVGEKGQMNFLPNVVDLPNLPQEQAERIPSAPLLISSEPELALTPEQRYFIHLKGMERQWQLATLALQEWHEICYGSSPGAQTPQPPNPQALNPMLLQTSKVNIPVDTMLNMDFAPLPSDERAAVEMSSTPRQQFKSAGGEDPGQTSDSEVEANVYLM